MKWMLGPQYRRHTVTETFHMCGSWLIASQEFVVISSGGTSGDNLNWESGSIL